MKHRRSVSTILKRNVKVRSDNPFGLRITVKQSFTRLAATDVLEKFNVVNCLKPLTMQTSLSQTVLFTRVQKDLKGKVFYKISQIQTASTKFLNSFEHEDFQEDYKQFKKRCLHCVDVQGSYFKDFQFTVQKYLTNFVFSNNLETL